MRTLWLLFTIIFINMLGFGLIIPLTPALKIKFGLTAVQVGILGGIFPLLQVFGSPILGAISDKIGRRYVIIVSFAIASTSYIILAYANSYSVLIISRIIGGFFSSSFVVAMTCASDLSTKETRMKYMGITGMAFGLGFMLGPAFGGFLAGNNIHAVNIERTSWVSFALGISSAIISLLFLPETLPHNKREKASSLAVMKDLFSNLNTVLNFSLTTILSFILAGTEIFVSIWLAEAFLFTPVRIGLFWTYYAIMMNFGRILFSRNVKGYASVIVFFSIICISFFGFVFSKYLFLIYLFITFIAISSGVLITYINTKVSLHGKPSQQGLVLGLNNGAGNFGRFVGPYVLGVVWQASSDIHVAWATLALVTLGAVFISIILNKRDSKI